MGIDSGRIISFTFGIGLNSAAAAGVLVGVYYNSIDPLMGIMPGLKSLRCSRFGRYRHFAWRYAGRPYLGRSGSAGKRLYFFHLPRCAAFAILILILLFRPPYGKNTREKV